MCRQLALNIDDETFQLARSWREYALSEKMLTRSRVMCFDANGLLALVLSVQTSKVAQNWFKIQVYFRSYIGDISF